MLIKQYYLPMLKVKYYPVNYYIVDYVKYFIYLVESIG